MPTKCRAGAGWCWLLSDSGKATQLLHYALPGQRVRIGQARWFQQHNFTASTQGRYRSWIAPCTQRCPDERKIDLSGSIWNGIGAWDGLPAPIFIRRD
jgi:hypothetical protein